jgi:hypothetical protein
LFANNKKTSRHPMLTNRKPQLNLVPPAVNRKAAKAATRDLGPAGQALWAEITAEYQFVEAAEIELLRQACGTADQIEAVGKLIKADGLMVPGKDGAKAHPLLKVQHLQRSFLARVLNRLGLLGEPQKVGRPPKGGTGVRVQR